MSQTDVHPQTPQPLLSSAARVSAPTAGRSRRSRRTPTPPTARTLTPSPPTLAPPTARPLIPSPPPLVSPTARPVACIHLLKNSYAPTEVVIAAMNLMVKLIDVKSKNDKWEGEWNFWARAFRRTFDAHTRPAVVAAIKFAYGVMHLHLMPLFEEPNALKHAATNLMLRKLMQYAHGWDCITRTTWENVRVGRGTGGRRLSDEQYSKLAEIEFKKAMDEVAKMVAARPPQGSMYPGA